MRKTFLLALAACLPLLLGGCLGGGGVDVPGLAQAFSQLRANQATTAQNQAITRWNGAVDKTEASRSRATSALTEARSARSQTAIAAARRTNAAFLSEAQAAVAAARGLQSAGVPNANQQLAAAQRELQRARDQQSEITRLEAARSNSGSGGGGSSPSDTGIERADPGDADREQVATWNAAVARHEAALTASRAATSAYNAAPSQARGQAAIAAIETVISLKENLVTLARNWRGSGLPEDLATLQSQLQSWQNSRNEWRTTVADRFGGSGGSDNGGSGGSDFSDYQAEADHYVLTARWSFLVLAEADACLRPGCPNPVVWDGTIISDLSSSIARDRTALNDAGRGRNSLFNRYVASAARSRNLTADGYRLEGSNGGIRSYRKTIALYADADGRLTNEARNRPPDGTARPFVADHHLPNAQLSDGRYLSFGEVYPRINAGTFQGYDIDRLVTGDYSLGFASGSFVCRTGSSLGNYCESDGNYTQASMVWDRPGRETTERVGDYTWRGVMTGFHVSRGGSLWGNATVTYRTGGTSTSRDDVVDVVVSNVRSVADGTASDAPTYGYGGPSRLSWTGLEVRGGYQFGTRNTQSSRILRDAQENGEDFLYGALAGPNQAEAAAIFQHSIPSYFSNRVEYHGKIIGALVAKR